MDAVFAILVLGAVIFFGALISAGNERQRKALEGIRGQVAQWAIQDLRLKREKLAREVKVDDPIAWLNRVVAKVYGDDLGLIVTDVSENPQILVCMAKDGRKVVLSPASLDEIKRVVRQHKSRLSLIGIPHQLVTLRSQQTELSMLNCGVLFDLELQIVWKTLAKMELGDVERLWVYWM